MNQIDALAQAVVLAVTAPKGREDDAADLVHNLSYDLSDVEIELALDLAKEYMLKGLPSCI